MIAGRYRPREARSAPRHNSTSGCGPRLAASSEFCWHVDIVPRLTIRAAFELGTGVDVNVYPPETSRVGPS